MLERFFGAKLTLSTSRVVSVHLIGEQDVREDPGLIFELTNWARCIRPQP